MKFTSLSHNDLNETLFKHSYANKLMEKQYNDIKILICIFTAIIGVFLNFIHIRVYFYLKEYKYFCFLLFHNSKKIYDLYYM